MDKPIGASTPKSKLPVRQQYTKDKLYLLSHLCDVVAILCSCFELSKYKKRNLNTNSMDRNYLR